MVLFSFLCIAIILAGIWGLLVEAELGPPGTGPSVNHGPQHPGPETSGLPVTPDKNNTRSVVLSAIAC